MHSLAAMEWTASQIVQILANFWFTPLAEDWEPLKTSEFAGWSAVNH